MQQRDGTALAVALGMLKNDRVRRSQDRSVAGRLSVDRTAAPLIDSATIFVPEVAVDPMLVVTAARSAQPAMTTAAATTTVSSLRSRLGPVGVVYGEILFHFASKKMLCQRKVANHGLYLRVGNA